MLKLEKKPYAKVSITIGERNSFWTPLLFKAFCLAMGVHLMAFLLFNIHAFKLSSTFTHAPIHVQTPRNYSKPTVEVDETVEEYNQALEFPLLAFLEKVPVDLEPPSSAFFSSTELRNHPFEENFSLHPAPPISFPLEITPYQIFITGELSNRKLIQADPQLNQKIKKQGPFPEPVYLSYKVQIDEDSGQIFWYESVSPVSHLSAKALAENLLLSLVFEKGRPFTHVSGQIDFVLHLLPN